MVDPEARTLETFKLGPGGWLVGAAFNEGDDVRALPFETLTVPLNALWPD